MSWLRTIAAFAFALAFVCQPTAASAFVAASPQARVGGFEVVASMLAGGLGDASRGQHQGIGAAYDENASGYRFAAGGARAAGQAPNRIYSARELMRRAAEPGPFHNFPESFNQQIFEQGSRTVTPNFWRTAKPGLSNDSVMYQLRGTVNGVEGTFEIGVRPSVSGNTEVIMHRFFRPDP